MGRALRSLKPFQAVETVGAQWASSTRGEVTVWAEIAATERKKGEATQQLVEWVPLEAMEAAEAVSQGREVPQQPA